MKKMREMKNFEGELSSTIELLKRTRRKKAERGGVEDMMVVKGCISEKLERPLLKRS
jgi:hypothetical protein